MCLFLYKILIFIIEIVIIETNKIYLLLIVLKNIFFKFILKTKENNTY